MNNTIEIFWLVSAAASTPSVKEERSGGTVLTTKNPDYQPGWITLAKVQAPRLG